ncbi:MAG: SPOR domain-containing protein [Candidatus Omnitrophica bacterium]|nr:SPOR domain-containing protein [Candidatus Omnitrophota bacterium]HOX54602.1 SPOR domain-containing protein [Candidatus Omnitrophota bacterium]
MENKQAPGQLELFSGSVDSSGRGGSHVTPWQKLVYLNIEQAIMISVIVLMAIILSFSLGVEKGKKANNVLNNRNTIVSEVQLTPKVEVREVPQEAKKAQEVLQKVTPQDKEIKQTSEADKYTIQVASFKKRSSVDEEAKSLQKKGYEIVILPKGNYIVLCVGRFSKREDANSYLGELRKKYKDCLIREL